MTNKSRNEAVTGVALCWHIRAANATNSLMQSYRKPDLLEFYKIEDHRKRVDKASSAVI